VIARLESRAGESVSTRILERLAAATGGPEHFQRDRLSGGASRLGSYASWRDPHEDKAQTSAGRGQATAEGVTEAGVMRQQTMQFDELCPSASAPAVATAQPRGARERRTGEPGGCQHHNVTDYH
jgi:hypothetical protein